MHILFILDYYKPHCGGSETVFENIITRLLTKGYKISVLTSHFKKSLPKIEKDNMLTIYRTGTNRILFTFVALRKGLDILRQNRDIQIIHTSTYGGAIPGSLLGLFYKKKVILTVHEIFGKLRYRYKGRLKGRVYHSFEKLVFCLKYNIYHCVSNYTMNSLRVCYGIPDSKIRMIHNGVDTRIWDPESIMGQDIIKWKTENNRYGRYVLLYYGHSGYSKGVDYLIQAIPDLIRIYPDILLVFNLIPAKRDKNIREKLQQFEPTVVQLEPTGTNHHVQVFDGFTLPRLKTLIASVDCVIAPSLSEGFGSVHTESCAMLKNLITTNIASIPEVVSGKVTFIRPGSIDEIVKRVQKTRNGEVESILQKHFSRDETVQKIEYLYKTEK